LEEQPVRRTKVAVQAVLLEVLAHGRQACGDRRQALLATRIGAGLAEQKHQLDLAERSSTASAPIPGVVEEKLAPHALAARAVALHRAGWQ
jgi:hypothetical protein